MKPFFVRNQITLAGLLLSIGSCSHSGKVPTWDGKIWAGDPGRGGITRRQEDEHLSCASPIFNDYMCMTYADFRSFYETYVLGCEKWPEGKKVRIKDQVKQFHKETGR